MPDKLLKFVKEEHELETDLDKWLYVLKNMNDLQKIPVFLRKTIFEKVFKIATYSNLTKEEKMLYDLDLKKQWDDYSALETATREGIEQGIEQGKHEFVVNLLSETNFGDDKIASLAKVSISYVQQVRAELSKK